jgi:enoyl-CoA hydratase/carnithine racemase
MTAMPDFESLLYDESDGVAWVTLNRPEALNAFNTTMQRELRELWLMLRTNDDVRCIVLTGSGDKAFCTGLDREGVGSFDDLPPGKLPGYNTPWDFDDPGKSVCPKSNDLWKPVIAAVNGMACGGAFYILGEVDFIIAADHATFFDPHVTYGMPAAFEPIFLLHKMPFQEVVRLALLGAHERMSANRAHQIGLVSEVVPSDELRERTEWAARAIADQPALAEQGTLRAMWMGLEVSRRQALDHAFLFTNVGSDRTLLEEGQERFTSGKRIEWRLR